MTKQHWTKTVTEERDSLKQQLSECQKECEEEARINGKGGSREAKLIAELDKLKLLIQAVHEELGSYYCNIEIVRKKLKDAI